MTIDKGDDLVSNNKLKWFGIIAAAFSLVITHIIHIDGLSDAAVHTLGVLLATQFLLLFESFNICVTCLISSALLFSTGCVESITEAFGGYSNHILYFTLASFGISLGVQKSSVTEKVLTKILGVCKKNIHSFIFAFMLVNAIMSAFISNVAAVILFLPFAEKLMSFYDNENDRKRSRRTFMICLTLSSMIGGLMTPAGSSINLICMDMLEKYADINVRFIDWMAVGIPLSLIMICASFLIVRLVYKPAELSETAIEGYLNSMRNNKRSSKKDIYIVILLLCTISAWILSSWIPSINITVTAIIALALMFVPSKSILTWEEFVNCVSWPTFFIAGAMISVAAAATNTGLCSFFINSIMPSSLPSSSIIVTAMFATITFIFLLFVPVAPAAVTVLVPIAIMLAQKTGVDPMMAAMTCSMCVCNCYLFPLDTVMVVAYDQKAFTMFELPKATVWVQLCMIVVSALWIPLSFRLFI